MRMNIRGPLLYLTLIAQLSVGGRTNERDWFLARYNGSGVYKLYIRDLRTLGIYRKSLN